MRKTPLLLISLLTPLLLAGCVDDSASYFVDGKAGSHALTVHRAQKHFWSNVTTVELIMQRLPDCMRRIELTDLPADEVEIELLSGGDNVWTLRSGSEAWQVESQTCTLYPDVKGDGGELIGVFRDDGSGRFVFEEAVLEPVPAAGGAAGSVPAPAQQ
ncbi:MAG: hypothetical protein ABW069_12415 [Duganella sp.]